MIVKVAKPVHEVSRRKLLLQAGGRASQVQSGGIGGLASCYCCIAFCVFPLHHVRCETCRNTLTQPSIQWRQTNRYSHAQSRKSIPRVSGFATDFGSSPAGSWARRRTGNEQVINVSHPLSRCVSGVCIFFFSSVCFCR